MSTLSLRHKLRMWGYRRQWWKWTMAQWPKSATEEELIAFHAGVAQLFKREL